MNSKLLFFIIKILKHNFINIYVILIAIIIWPLNTVAQKSKFFTINGKHVNADNFNRQIIHLMDEIGVPGMSLAIIDNNEIVFYESYGFKYDDKRVNKKTIFNGLSLSKTFLAFVAYQLVDEGKLDLDKPMYEYLEYKPLQHDVRYKQITPRMVLSHSSGVENWKSWNNRDTLEIISNPGEKYIYSGEGYQYLAKVIEKQLNQTYEDFIDERVIEPLKLRNTYLKYTQKKMDLFHKEAPWNYAVGHKAFGQHHTSKNFRALPAAGNHFTAEDYAKLVLAFFDSKRLTSNRKNDILEPMVRIHNSSIFYGPGFELILNSEDTIIAHGGDAPGYRNLMFYSVIKKRGLVFMTNSERGKLMADQLCKMTVDLNINPYLKSQYYMFEQYPSIALSLLRVYDEEGYDTMVVRLKKLKKERKISVNTLNVLADFVRLGGDIKGSKELLEENISLYPDSSLAYVLLAKVFMEIEDYELAYANFTKAKELNFNFWDTELDVKKCKEEVAEIELRKVFLVKIYGNEEITIQAEDYNTMNNIRIEKSFDEGDGQSVGYIDAGDWMDYQIDISAAGTYLVTFRIASLNGGGKLEIHSNTTALAIIDIPSTNGWEKWTSITKTLNLPAGVQTLRLYANAGGFNVNWLKFNQP